MPLSPDSVRDRVTAVVAVTVAAIAATGCSEPPPPEVGAAAARPLVVISVAPHRYFVEALAGNAVEIVALLPPGASPTSFEPGIDTLRSIGRAQLLVRVGHPHFPFERAWLDDLLNDRSDLLTVDAQASLDEGNGGGGGHRAGDRIESAEHLDPHNWLSPAAVLALVDALEPAVAQLLDDAPAVGQRAATLREQIRALDAELGAQLASVRGGRFLVLHPAWGHFAESYGLEQIAIERDGKPPGPRELAQLVRDAREAGLQSVIVVPQTDPAQARSVAEAIGGRIVELDPLAADWPAAMRRTAQVLAREAVVR